MELKELRRRFADYASGDLSESELRNVIRAALVEEPMLATAYVALAAAYRRANVIDDELQSSIVADITDVTGPHLEAGDGRTLLSKRDTRSPSAPGGARAGSPMDEPFPVAGPNPLLDGGIAFGFAGPVRATKVSAPTALRSRAGTGPTTGSGSWDSADLQAVAAGAAAGASPLAPGAVLKDRFEVLEELGRGGMGIVYRALDRRTAELDDRHCYVAIKVLNEEFQRHPLAVRALQRESRKAKTLAHPNIMRVYDFDRDGGNVYMVMELLSGRSLDRVIRTDGSRGLPLHRVMQIVKSLGSALGYAHEQGIVHSDFKPSNAFITDEGTVKVLDFGIARAAPSHTGRTEQTTFDAGALGAISPSYASVEMLTREEQPDVRDDIYALAVVTYELLTGRHPFNRIDALKARGAGLEPQPVRRLSRAQWQALRQGLAFERGDRTPSVEAFVAGLIKPGRRKAIWWAAAAAVLAIGIAVALIASRPWETRVISPIRDWIAAHSPSTNPRPAGEPERKPTQVPGTGGAGTAAGDTVEARAEREELADLIARPEASERWATAVQARLQKLSASAGPGDKAVTEARQTAVGTFVHAAADARNAKQYAEAKSLLETARTFDPQSLSVEEETAALERDQSTPAAASVAPGSNLPTPEQTVANDQQQAEIEALKSKLATQAAAGDVAGENATATVLRRIPGASTYVSRDMTRTLIDGYVHLAKSQLAAGHVDEALQTLATARKKFGSREAQLKDLEARYVAVGDAYDRLTVAVSLNVSEQRAVLDALRTSEGEDYPVTEEMLARTLANRIADQRAADRPSVATSLLEAGRTIFPDHAALLEQGTAGVLSGPTVEAPPEETTSQ